MLEGWKNPGLSGLPTNRGFRNHSGRVLETAGYTGLGLGPHNSQQRAGRARCVSAYQCVKKWAQAKHRLGKINDLPKAVNLFARPGTPLHSGFPADISRREDGSEGSKRSDALAIVRKLDARAISEHSDSPGSVIDGGEYQQPWKSKTHKLLPTGGSRQLPGFPRLPPVLPWLPRDPPRTGEGKKLDVSTDN
ncbi:predicted protein [Histoplasma capsulatum H143]|uniref:Uncharacterized protein n=1 Tax=Ajellomyces capsulatus (strain H143) TaxID=544712 RepID=C6HF32_AJECH|nr:predicted protein [Histoplasma capsulatum H143]